MKRHKYNPELIDNIVHENCQTSAIVGNQERWFIAKKEPYMPLMKRLRHAWLVFTGQATAIVFIDDLRDILQ